MTFQFFRSFKTPFAVAAVAVCLGAFTSASAQLDGGLRVPQNQVAFLNQLYADALKRQVDGLSLVQMEALLNAGASSTHVSGVVPGSNEFRALTVQDHYQAWFRRPATAAEVSFGADMLARLPLESFQAHILGSEEYYQHSGDSESGFLQRLYLDVLNRLPAAAEMLQLTRLMSSGQSRSSVATYSLGSQEHQRLAVVQEYQAILRRQPNNAELNTVAAAMGNGGASNFLIALLFGSPEYLQFALRETVFRQAEYSLHVRRRAQVKALGLT